VTRSESEGCQGEVRIRDPACRCVRDSAGAGIGCRAIHERMQPQVESDLEMMRSVFCRREEWVASDLREDAAK
jgi:hypothetical protein